MRKLSVLALSCMMVLSMLLSSVAGIIARVSEVIVNDSDVGSNINQITYSAGWGESKNQGDRFHGGDEHWFNFAHYQQGQPLPHFTMKFNGTGIELYGEKQPGLGIYNVYIDDVKVATVDAYSATAQRKVKLFTKTDLVNKEHTLKVELSNTKNASSTACDGEIDYIKVLGVENASTSFVTTIEDSATTTKDELFKFKYSNGWVGSSGPDFSNGDEHYANAGASFEMKFQGTKIELYATKAPNHGNYIVEIDGKDAGTANAKSEGNRQNKQCIYTSANLTDALHTIKVTLPASATGDAIQIDYAKVYHGAIAATEVVLNSNKLTLEATKTASVQASVLPSVATNKELVWTSNNESVATVSNTGVISAIKAGTATITATIKDTQIRAEVVVTVVPKVEFMSAYVSDVNALETQDDYDASLTKFTNSWKDVAWRGDTLLSKVNLCTRDQEIHNAQVIVSDFTNGQHRIAASNVEVNWLKEVEANVGRGNSSAPVKKFPEMIHKGGKINIPANKLQSAWLTIHVPTDAKAGTYTGTVTVRADELTTPYTFAYEFEVIDLLQPSVEATNTQIQLWQHPFSVANYYLGLGQNPQGGITNETREDFYFSPQHFNLMRESMKEYAALGGHDVVANIVEEAWGHQSYYNDLSMVKWTKKSDGTFVFDYTWYDKWIDFQVECGVLDPQNNVGQIKCYSIVPWNNQVTYFDEKTNRTVHKSMTPGSEEWQSIWRTFLTDFMKHSKEKGWFDITYISMDERVLEQLTPAVEVIESVKDDAGKHFKISSALNYAAPEHYSFTDRIHDISINLGNANNISQMQALGEHRRGLGLTTTIYTCTGDYPSSFTISDPSDSYWTMWFTLQTKTDGFMRWAWDNYVYDMHGNVSYRYWEPGDGWFVYPQERETIDMNKDARIYKTPRYEMLKKGLRDISKAKYLMQQSNELKTQVETLVNSLQRPRKTTLHGSATYVSEEDRQLAWNEVERMEKGINDLARAFALKPQPQELTVTIQKDDKLKITLDGKTELTNTFVVGTEVSVEASVVDADRYVFKRWEDAKGNVLSTSPKYTFTVKADTTLKAVCEKIATSKDALQEAIKEATAIDSSKYTDETVKVLKDALANGQKVYDDQNASQKEIDAATKAIKEAMNGLANKPGTPLVPIEPSKPVKPQKPDTQKPNESKPNKDETGTGDVTSMGMLASMVVASGASVVGLLKRRNRK